jgi:hypothetical protein
MPRLMRAPNSRTGHRRIRFAGMSAEAGANNPTEFARSSRSGSEMPAAMLKAQRLDRNRPSCDMDHYADCGVLI